MFYLSKGGKEIKCAYQVNIKSILAVDTVATIMTFVISLGKSTNA